MAWVTPTNRTTGDVISASDWNQAAVANVAYLKGQAGAIVIENNATMSGLTVTTSGVTVLGGVNVSDYVQLATQGSAPSTPSAGYVRVYLETASGNVVIIDSSGTTRTLGGGGGARSFLLMGA
jgi:hypothetical protein